jgi:hypothetical protein
MTIFELYSANVPIVVPDATLLRQLGCVASLAHYGGGMRYGARRDGARRSSDLAAAASVDFFISRADFYDAELNGMPHITTFSSADELGRTLAAIDTRAVSATMEQANEGRARRVRSAWRCLMEGAFPALAASRSSERDVRTSNLAAETQPAPAAAPAAAHSESP